MSSIYITEPPTSGKVLLETTHGDVEIELWCKEAPLACRNFIQLCMEGYYDNTIFHRIVKDFLIQGGDPTGTGMGGDSVYGKPFKNEIHSRLKFQRRGLVAMVNDEEGNGSQFFITLNRADDLNKKNTIFGTLKGNTLFNVLQMAELPCSANDRPEDPPRIKRVEVLNAYFTDIEPRVTAASRLAAAAAVAQSDAAKKKKKRKVKAVKDFKLMSFGDEAEEEEISTIKAKAKVGKIVSSHDAGVDSKLSKQAGTILTSQEAAAAAEAAVAKDRAATKRKAAAAMAAVGSSGSKSGGYDDDGSDDDNGDGEMEDKDYDARMKAKMARKRAKKEANGAGNGNANRGMGISKAKGSGSMPVKYQFQSAEERIAAINEEARKIKEEIKKGGSADASSEAAEASLQIERTAAQKLLDEQAAQYDIANAALTGISKKKRQDDTLAMLGMFTSQLKSSVQLGGGFGGTDGGAVDADEPAAASREESAAAAEEGAGSDEEYDDDWMSGALQDAEYDKFETEGIDPQHDPNTLTLEDPRNPMNQRRRGEKEKSGGGWRDGDRGGKGSSSSRSHARDRDRRDGDRYGGRSDSSYGRGRDRGRDSDRDRRDDRRR